MEFGVEEKTEQMLQILNSSEVRDMIINKFDLMKHYNINPNSRYPLTKLFAKYNDNISFKRTEYRAVEIEVLDEDQMMVADIANGIAACFDTIINKIQKERSGKGLQFVEKEYNDLTAHIKTINDSINIIRDLGILDYDKQTEVITSQYAAAIAKSNGAGAKVLDEKLKTLAKYGGEFILYKNEIANGMEKLGDLNRNLQESRVDAEQILPQKFVVDRAQKPEKSSYPVRWLISLLSAISTFVLSVIVIVFIDKYKN